MNHPLRQLLVWLGCLHLIAGGFGLAQVAAWTGMAVRYTMVSGLIQGLEQTFDGSRPCHLCRAITRAKLDAASDSGTPAQTPRPGEAMLREPWFPPDEMAAVLAGPGRNLILLPAASALTAGRNRGAPPAPPPRLLV